MSRVLTERRAADRGAIVRALVALAGECGASASVEDMGPRWDSVTIGGERGLRVTVDVDGDSPTPGAGP